MSVFDELVPNWNELFPGKLWPGEDHAVRELITEVRALRLLNDTIVTTALDEYQRMRSREEIQRAHDLISQYCVEMNEDWGQESALCWVLRHTHNPRFAEVLATVEGRMEHLGFHVTPTPDLPQAGPDEPGI